MILDIGFVVLLIIFMFLGYRRGFSLEFFNMFKYIFIIFITNYVYKFFLDSEGIKSQNQLKVFIVIVAIQYLAYSAILIINKKFLKSIKINKFDKLSGMIFGIMKLFFVAIIVYIVVIAGSLKSKSIKNARNKSICIKIMTKYALRFTDSFPGFIENDVKRYVISQREKEVINDVLHDYENPEPDKFEKSKEIN
ncbi:MULTISPECIES: CvpA family protein [Leptotrichia]|jgi:colicin V production protein|uniref:CvpA family protein n=1 Tax=Leptotrichia wadei TaxID=157687 RepID=A0A510KUR7_9FUSO|nr:MULTISPECIES: CvpA family protein [Leptotrichia]MBS6019461.1 CvpA family protein [Leptotrichia wadei]NWO27751.1 CvpA family protein [Leptotrichia sp. oral taxon 417]BBM55460.1 CvpA family protein [Leptotrichia wadei]